MSITAREENETKTPSDYVDIQRKESLTSDSDEAIDWTGTPTLQRLYQKKVRETLIQAVLNDYNGVDVVHLETQHTNGSGLHVWQATKWRSEPRATPTDSYQRYDFRYYDDEVLLTHLSHGE